MSSKPFVKIVLLLVWVSMPLLAVEGKIKVFIPSQDAIYTSQKMTVSVEVLSSAFSITNVQITFPASDKYLVQAPKSASYLGREAVGSEMWQMVHYDYDLYALKAGRIDIPSVLVTFTASMGYGQPKKAFELKSEAFSFEVRSPKGVTNDQFVLVTDAFEVTMQQKPEVQQLIVGDAIELSIIQQAHHVPDILFQPVVYTSNPWMRVYTKEPELKSGIKGQYDVSRTDRFTLVASVEGNVTFPAQQRVWYDPKLQKLHTDTLPTLVYEILPDPQIAIDAQNEKHKRMLVYIAFGIGIFVIFYFLFARKVKHYMREKKERYRQSEEGKFEGLLSSIEHGSLQEIDRDYRQWFTVLNPTSLRGGLKEIESIDPTFISALRILDKAIVKSEDTFDRKRFAHHIKIFRKKLLKEKNKHVEGLPKEINPR